MVHTENWVPGIVAAGPAGTHTLPTDAPGIAQIVGAYILRAVGFTVGDHAGATIALALGDHAVHGHDITTVIPAGAGTALTEAVIPGLLEAAGGGQINPAAVDVLAAAQAHGAGAAVAHVIGAGDPVVAAVATRITRNTLQLDVPTLVGDILFVRYLPEGVRIRS